MRVDRFASVMAFALLGLLVATVAADDPPARRPQPVKKKGATTANQPQLSDDEVLAKAKLSATDGKKLIEYLKARTLSDSEQGRINEIIKRFGADDFDDRVRATEEIESYGPAAVGPLKAAAKSSDAEVAFRAKVALKKVETVPHTAVVAAAVRAVVKLKPEGAAAALIGYLPLADDETVAEEIRDALVSLAATKDGTADPALVAALADGSPVRRTAAYVSLVTGGPAAERIRLKDAYPKVREAVLKDADPEAKFVGLWSLALTTREREYIPELVALIPKVGRGRIWQLEDLLLQLAGTHPKGGRFLKSPESLATTRDAWLAWWKEKGDATDLVKFDYKPRVTGVTDIVEFDGRGLNPARIVSLGPDMKEKWRITGMQFPSDVQVAPNGNAFVVEMHSNQVSERTTTGTLVHRQYINQAVNLRLTPDGGVAVIARNGVFEFDKEWKQPKDRSYTRKVHDVVAGRRLPNGQTFLIVNSGRPQGASGILLDEKLKETGKPIPLGPVHNQHVLDAVGDDRVLICEAERVAEYDLKTGKQTWKYDCNGPTSCQRLVNGNTLIAMMNVSPNGRVIEVDPSGEIVWEYKAKDTFRASRAYRR